MNKYSLLIGLIFLINIINAQITHSSNINNQLTSTSIMQLSENENIILNSEVMHSFYAKLAALQNTKKGQINIVHIGDSHLQGEEMSGKIRSLLQQKYGNAGRGFVFPNRLARTNGASDVRFKSNTVWKSYRNIYPVKNFQIGLSGLSLTTASKDFYIDLQVASNDSYFNKIKIITPHNESSIGIAKEKILLSEKVLRPKKVVHRIKRGETLSEIASKYNLSIDDLKKANRIKGNKIQMGKVLKIPSTQTVAKTVSKYQFVPLPIIHTDYYDFFESEIPLNQVFFIANKLQDTYSLNGIVLENGQSGILYHNIGVNGAKYSDFNKYDLFFKQLQALQPDLIIVSLGTNESFSKIPTQEYLAEIQQFNQRVIAVVADVPMLLTTPPPSQFKRKLDNNFALDYALQLLANAKFNHYAVWDLYEQMAGINGVNRNFSNGIITSDKIHYTAAGYEKQATLFVDAFIQGFANFLKLNN